MSTLLFVGQFVASKAGATGLTVTVDVDRYALSDGARTALVTGGSATEGRRGLYHYRLTSADLSQYQYVATFITAGTADQQEVAALGLVVPDALPSTLAPASTALSNATWTDAKAGYLTGNVALEATLTAIKGAGWTTETLAALKVLIDAISAKTTNLPAQPAAVGSAMTLAANQDVRHVSGTITDKTGYALTAAYDAAKTASSQASVDAKPTAEQVRTEMDANSTRLAHLDVDVGSRLQPLVAGRKLATDANGHVLIQSTHGKNKLDNLKDLSAATVAALVSPLTRLPVPQAVVTGSQLAQGFEMWGGGSGAAPTAGPNFGAWVFCEAADGQLFAGLGNVPADTPDAVIVRVTTDDAVELFLVLDDDGIAEIRAHGSKVYALGADAGGPAGEDWTAGNVYVWNGTWTKRRTLPNVLHVLCQTWVGDVWYVGTGAHTGDNQTWTGKVFKSSDDGATWTALAAEVTDYRVYNLAWFRDRLYAVGMDGFQYWAGAGTIYTSTDDGATWVNSNQTVMARPRWVEHLGQLVAVGLGGASLVIVAADGTISTQALPFALNVGNYQQNVLLSVGTVFYALGTTGIWASGDLAHWAQVANLNDPLSIGLWASRGVLLVSSRGTAAQVYDLPATRGDVLAFGRATAAEAASKIIAQVSEGNLDLVEIIRVLLAHATGSISNAASGTHVYKSNNGLKDRITMTVDEDGNRINIILDGS